MAMMAPKIPLSGPLGGSSQHPSRNHLDASHGSQMPSLSPSHEQLFTSPTESEFSLNDGMDSVRYVWWSRDDRSHALSVRIWLTSVKGMG